MSLPIKVLRQVPLGLDHVLTWQSASSSATCLAQAYIPTVDYFYHRYLDDDHVPGLGLPFHIEVCPSPQRSGHPDARFLECVRISENGGQPVATPHPSEGLRSPYRNQEDIRTSSDTSVHNENTGNRQRSHVVRRIYLWTSKQYLQLILTNAYDIVSHRTEVKSQNKI